MSKEKQAVQQQKQQAKRPLPTQEVAPVAELTPALTGLDNAAQLNGLPAVPSSRPIRQAAVLRMQQTQGNTAVQRYLSRTRRSNGHGNGTAVEADSVEGAEFLGAGVPTLAPAPPPNGNDSNGNNGNNGESIVSRKVIQPKLTVNEPGDRFEQEADQVADDVIRGESTVTIPLSPPDDSDQNGSPPISQVQASGDGVPNVSPETEKGIERLNGQGTPLPHAERQYFEDRMGADLSQVRLHTDPDAIQLSRDLHAKAFTVGNNIAFDEGAYQPGTSDGRRLLAHELTHTIQQGAVNRIQRQEDPAALVVPAADVAPASPEEDPAFQKVKKEVKQEAVKEKQHEPAGKKAQESQAAANMPEEEKMGKAQKQKAGEIESAASAQAGKAAGGSAPGFDKAAFKSAIKAKIQGLTPQEPKQMENLDSSGVMDQVEGAVKSKVDSGKEAAQGNVDDKVAETPDKGGVAAKPVTPLKANNPGEPPQNINAAKAAPKAKGQSEVEQPLNARSQSLDQKMAEADVTEEQLQKGNEPEFDSAMEAKKESQEHAEAAPGGYRAGEGSIITGKKGEAESAEQAKMQAMHNGKVQAVGDLDSLQNVGKSDDEAKRKEIGQKIDGIYEATKKDVEATLKQLDADVDKVFGPGAKQAAQTAISYVKRETKAYKDARYTGDGSIGDRIVGGVRWIGDELGEMPPEYFKIYDRGRDKYIAEMDIVLDRVADIVGAALTKAKARIAQGKQEIETFVAQQPQDLRQVAQEAANNIQSKFSQLEQSVNDKENELINSLAEQYQAGLNDINKQFEAMMEEDKGLWQKAKEKIGGALEMIAKMKDMLMGVLASAASAIDKIIKDPIGFLGNLLSGIKQGLMQFVGNIGTHLKKGLMKWLFGAMAGAGITLPESLDLKGILSLAMQLLGLTWANLRMRAVKMFGEKIVTGLEKAFEIFVIVREQGLSGLWEYIKDKLTDLKTMVIDGIKDMVITQVIQAGIKWLIGILGGPAGAFVKACMAIYDIIMWFVNNGSQLMGLIQAVAQGIAAVASGNISGMASAIENALAKAIPVVIGFLASLLGLGDIAGKIKGIIQKVQEPINKAIDWVLGKAKGLVKKIGSKLGFGKKKKEKEKAKDPAANKKAQEKARALVSKATQRPFADEKALKGKIKQIETTLKPEGLKSLKAVPKSSPKGKYDVIARADVGDASVEGMENIPEDGARVSVKFKSTAKRFSNATIRIDRANKSAVFIGESPKSPRVSQESWRVSFARLLELEGQRWQRKPTGYHSEFKPVIYSANIEGEEWVVTFGYENDDKQKKFTVRQRLSDYMTTSIKGTNLTIKPAIRRGVTEDIATHQTHVGMEKAHLIADEIGGPGYKESLNLISTSAKFNGTIMKGAESRIKNAFNGAVDAKGADSIELEVNVTWGEFVDGKAATETEAQIKARVAAEIEAAEKATAQERIHQFVQANRSRSSMRPKRCEKVVYKATFKNSAGAEVGGLAPISIGPDEWIEAK